MGDDEAYPQLLSLAVHEFRTPVSVVGGYLRMLQRDGDQPLSERQRKMIEEAERSCARIVALVGELSEIGKLDGGSLTLTRQPFDLFAAVREVADGVHEAEDRGVRLEVRGEASGSQVIGDGPRIKAAFAAIFRAILRERTTPGVVVVDCGIESAGPSRSSRIVAADAERVQAAYAAPRGAFDERRGGLGLALPLARRVIEAHGGAVRAPAGEEGRGTAIITLPIGS